MRAEDVNTRILVELWNVAEIARRSVAGEVDRRAPCTLTQFLVMDILASPVDNLTPTTLASRLGCSRANATQLLGGLKYRDWLTIEPSFGDLRGLVMRLSEQGLAAYGSYARPLAAVADEQLATLDIETKQLFARILRCLAGSRGRW